MKYRDVERRLRATIRDLLEKGATEEQVEAALDKIWWGCDE
jgi:hypothetical protein